MTLVNGKSHGLAKALTIRVVGMDEHTHVRHLHTKSMENQSADSLTDAEIQAFTAFVRSSAYSDILKEETLYGAFTEGQLIGTASWQVNGDDGQMARISSVFVDPMFLRLGIGGRLLTEVEARAFQSGFNHLSISTTLNAIPFFEKAGYHIASRGVKALGPNCLLPVAFLRKSVPRLARPAQAKTPAPVVAEPAKT